MKKIILSVIAMPMLLSFGGASADKVKAAPVTTAGVDKSKQGADHAKVAADKAKASALYHQASHMQNLAKTHWEVSNMLWSMRQETLRKYHTESAAANSYRRQAHQFAAEGHRLHQAEVLRGQAFNYHYAADRRLKAAQNHLVAAEGAAKSISSGETALKDLATNPAFANALADIKADIAKLKASEASHRALAKADQQAAEGNLKHAGDLEKRAASLEAPAFPVKAIVLVKPAAPAPIVTPVAVKQEVAKVASAAVVQAAPVATPGK